MDTCTTGCRRLTETPLCPHCWSVLAADLRSTSDLLAELEITLTRQGRGARGHVGLSTGNATALPVDTGASDAGRQLRDLLASWVRDLHETFRLRWEVCPCGWSWLGGERAHRPPRVGSCVGPWEPRVDELDVSFAAAPLAAWLLRHRTWIITHPAAAELHEEITGAFADARGTLDRPEPRDYLGICSAETPDGECPRQLYATPGRDTALCRDCGAVHDVAWRRAVLLDALGDELGTPRRIADVLGGVAGIAINVKTVRTWARRGELVPVACDVATGAELFRLADVVARGRRLAALNGAILPDVTLCG